MYCILGAYTAHDENVLKVILRFNEENGVHSMSTVKLTTILKKVGEIKMAKVLGDGNLFIISKMKSTEKGHCRIKEIEKCKVINASCVEKGSKWNKRVIWGIPVVDQ